MLKASLRTAYHPASASSESEVQEMGREGRIGLRVGSMALLITAVVAFAFVQPVSASLTAVATDPVGDAFYCSGVAAPSYEDIVKVEITKEGGAYILIMEVAGAIPANPPLVPPGESEIEWAFGLDTNLSATPPGYPGAGFFNPEFVIRLRWNGTSFFGEFIDRRSLLPQTAAYALTGGGGIGVPAEFTVDQATITFVIPGSLMDNPTSFRFEGLTGLVAAGSLIPNATTCGWVDTLPQWADWPS